eukprot:scaffold180781_cov18-Tisochrysis_lutea.AAC.2
MEHVVPLKNACVHAEGPRLCCVRVLAMEKKNAKQMYAAHCYHGARLREKLCVQVLWQGRDALDEMREKLRIVRTVLEQVG